MFRQDFTRTEQKHLRGETSAVRSCGAVLSAVFIILLDFAMHFNTYKYLLLHFYIIIVLLFLHSCRFSGYKYE